MSDSERGPDDGGGEADPPPRSRASSRESPTEEARESKLFTYVVPFAAALFLALGIAGAVTGGWAIVQPAIGGCSNPVITVDSPEDTADRLAEDGPTLERLEFEELTPAEQRAIEEAIEDPQRDGTIEGGADSDTLEALDRGVIVTVDGTDHYVTLASESRCLEVDPLVLPLGVASLLVGIGAFVIVAYLNYPKRFDPGLEWP